MTPSRGRRSLSRPTRRRRTSMPDNVATGQQPDVLPVPANPALPVPARHAPPAPAERQFEVVPSAKRIPDVAVAWQNMSVEESSSLGLEVGRHVCVYNLYRSLVSVGYGVDRRGRWLTWLSDVPQNLVYLTISERRSLAEDLATAVVVDLALGYTNADAALKSGLVLLNDLAR